MSDPDASAEPSLEAGFAVGRPRAWTPSLAAAGAAMGAVGGDATGDGARVEPEPLVTFHRLELDLILRVYGRMVAAGEWRDYGLDFLKDRAVFSIFRRTAELPLYTVEKTPRLARRQGAYSVTAAGGLILKRGHELDRVLRVFDKKLKLVD